MGCDNKDKNCFDRDIKGEFKEEMGFTPPGIMVAPKL